MSKKKVLIIVMAALAVIAAIVFVVPVFAESASPTVAASQITPANKPGALVRLLLVQDEAKVDAYIAQAVKVKDFWTAHHKQFAWNFVLRRLLHAQDENNVKTYLDKAVANGKLTQAQEDKVIAIWEILHAPAPAATS
jgi:hypothetical protein